MLNEVARPDQGLLRTLCGEAGFSKPQI